MKKSSEFKPIKKLMVANRSEIAIGVFRSTAHEMGMRTVAVYEHGEIVTRCTG